MYNKNNIAVAKVAAKSRIRPELACVAFYGDRTVATDSFMLIEMSADGERRDEPILRYADELKRVKLGKGETVGEDGLGKEADTDNAYPSMAAIEPLTKGKYAEIHINAEYLERVCSVLKHLNKFQQVTLRVPVGDLNRPVVILAESHAPREGEHRQTARALVMPIKS